MTSIKKCTAAGLSGLLLTASLASAQAQAVEVSGDVTFVSDYAFRGISQTEEAPALQGGLTLAVDSGWYLSVWGSSVDFGGQGTLELDVLLGWSGDIAEGWSADVGIMRYGYPNTEFEGRTSGNSMAQSAIRILHWAWLTAMTTMATAASITMSMPAIV